MNKLKSTFSNLALLLLVSVFILSFGDKGFGKTLWLSAIMYLLIAGSMLLLILSKPYKNDQLIANKLLSIYFGFYVIWLLLAPYFSAWFDMSRLTTWLLLLTPLSFYLSSYISLNENQKKALLIVYLCVGLFFFIWSDLHFIVTKDRPSGPLVDTNVFAGLLIAFLLPVQTYLCTVVSQSKIQNKINDYLYIYVIVGSLALFTTHSRSAFLAYALTGILVIIKILKEYKLVYIKRLFAILLIVSASYISIQSYRAVDEMPGFTNIVEDKSMQIRMELWEKTFDLYKTKPITGIGFGQFKSQYKKIRTSVDHISSGDYSHNDYLQFMAEGGTVQLVFIAILALYIIALYAKLFFSRPERKTENIILLSVLSVCCVFFIQANANFIFYVMPNAIAIGLILGIVTKKTTTKNLKLDLNLKSKLLICLISLFAFVTLFLDTYSQQHYYMPPTSFEGSVNHEKKDKIAKLILKIRPKSLALQRYDALYQLSELPKSSDYISVHESINKALAANPNDALTLHYLAQFSETNPSEYKKLITNTHSSGTYKSSEELYINSMEDDPTLLANYYKLRKIYKKRNEHEKAYSLFREKLYPRFDYGEFGIFAELHIANTLISDAQDLGYMDDVKEYATLVLTFSPCDKKSLEAIEEKTPVTCKSISDL